MAEKENRKDKLENLKKCSNELGIWLKREQRTWKN
jgi:hypothetical protein